MPHSRPTEPETLGLKPNSDFPPGEDNARWHLRITILHSSLGQQLGLGIKLCVNNLFHLTLKPQPQCMWAFSVATEKSNVLLTQLFGIWTSFCLFWNLLASSLYPWYPGIARWQDLLWVFFSFTILGTEWPLFFFLIYVFIFGCAGSSFLGRLFSSYGKQGLLSSCCVQASHCGGLSFCRAQALDVWLQQLLSCDSQASEHRLQSCGAWA